MKDDKTDFKNEIDLRRKAEEALLTNKNKVGLIKDIDTQRLLHELQVHQIELEMQNEELQEAYNTAETALKKYTMLYDFAPTGYFTLNRNGTITDLNFTAAEMLGQRRIRIINRNFRFFVSDNMKSIFNNFLHDVFTSYTKEYCEITLNDDNNLQCFVHIEGIVIEEDSDCLMSAFDISKFKRATSFE